MTPRALVFLLAALAAAPALAQRVPDPSFGNPLLTQWGILDGNRVRTLYANHGEISRFPDQPSAEWPKGSGHSYIDGIAFIVSASTTDANGETIYPMSTNYREFIDRDPITRVPWGWAPLPGYSNPRQESPARSDDERTWPAEWPDRPIDWAGQWNGYFGRGVTNADVETYFVMDDAPDPEWTLPPHQFFPCPGQPARGGLGLEVAVRGFQWNHPLAQDVIFWVYEITNECDVDYDDIVFAQYLDWGVGGTDDSSDDAGAYNTRLDLAFAYDTDGIGSPGQWSPVGTAGYAFLESPGNSTDGLDNDEDGITDERRGSGPGQLIEGADAIRAAVAARYNVADFERFYGAVDNSAAVQSGRWWTGDENLNWQTFSDLDENGQYDPGEPLGDDVGQDGLGPEALNYPGRDLGEGDGQPTDGEPNFDSLDKDESDQIGLTGFKVFDVHNFELTDDAQNYNVFREALPPIDVVLEGGRNLGMFFASGPFPLAAGQTERFSMALLFADRDFTDPREIDNSALARKKQTVQQIYNANYRFARPPDKPTLIATPGDGEVTLTWDSRAEQSYDPFLREFDFEGYMIYRSTEPNFRERLLVTDAYGNPIYQRPLAQFDLVNGRRGLHPVPVNGVQFNLGTDSGLRHSFVDRDVINGQTYYYALVAYDRGFVALNPDGSLPTTPDGQVDGLSPSITTAVINNDLAGNVVTDVNTAVATPRAPAAGYVAPEVSTYDADVRGTGPIDLAIVAPGALRDDTAYRFVFENPSVWDTLATPTWTLVETATGTARETGTVQPGLNEVPLVDGFQIAFDAPPGVSVVESSVAFTAAGDGGTYVPIVQPGTVSPAVAPTRYVPYPYDYEIRFAAAPVDTSLVLAFGQTAIPIPFEVFNTTLGRRQRVIVIEDNPDLRNQMWDPGDLIVFVDGVTPGATPIQAGGQWTAGWAVRLLPPDEGTEVRAPAPGAVLAFETVKPYATGDVIDFSFTAPGFDAEQAASQLDDIYVVPNPYVAASTFEPSSTYTVGRGERRIYFMNLPPECTIRIYTITGALVQTLTHSAGVDDGQEPWDLTSRDGMDVAFGVYLFHVDAPGVGTSIGRFALIK